MSRGNLDSWVRRSTSTRPVLGSLDPNVGTGVSRHDGEAGPSSSSLKRAIYISSDDDEPPLSRRRKLPVESASVKIDDESIELGVEEDDEDELPLSRRRKLPVKITSVEMDDESIELGSEEDDEDGSNHEDDMLAESFLEEDEDGEEELADEEDDIDLAKLKANHKNVQAYLDRYAVDLFSKEVREALALYKERVKFTLDTLHEAAKKIGKADTCAPGKAKDNEAMTTNWWSFLLRINPDMILSLFLRHTPLLVQAVLGKKAPNRKDLLNLPEHWEVIHKGVYVDVAVDDYGRVEPYCGSAVGKDGLARRVAVYHRVNKYGATERGLRTGGKHIAYINRDDVRAHPRILAVFDQKDVNSAYCLLHELVHTIYFGSLGKAPSDGGGYRTEAALKLCNDARHPSLPAITMSGLNHAPQLLQGLRVGRRERICNNPNCRTEKAKRYVPENSGMPFEKVICDPCAQYRLYNGGASRPKEVVDRHMNKVPLKKVCSNPVCRATDSSEWRANPTMPSGAALCSACHQYYKAHKKMRSKSLVDDAKAKKAPKPLIKGYTCYNDNCKATESSKWSGHGGIPASKRFCSSCYNYYKNHNRTMRPKELCERKVRMGRAPKGGPRTQPRKRVNPPSAPIADESD